MLEGWVHQNALWNMAGMRAMAKHPRFLAPRSKGCWPTQGDALHIAHLTRRMCLFENSIPPWVLLWESFYIHTHTILKPPYVSFSSRFAPSRRAQQLSSLHNSISAVSDWSLLICGWVNGEGCSLSSGPPRDHLARYTCGGVWSPWQFVDLFKANLPRFWLFTYLIVNIRLIKRLRLMITVRFLRLQNMVPWHSLCKFSPVLPREQLIQNVY